MGRLHRRGISFADQPQLNEHRRPANLSQHAGALLADRHPGWRLLAQTNRLELGISQFPGDWTTVPGSDLTNRVIIPISTTKSNQFFRMVYP